MNSNPRFSLLLLSLVSLCAAATLSAQNSGSLGRMDQSLFLNPPAAYRAVPFYSLNDSLSAPELRRQIGLFHEAGYGGTFLHSRIGLLTPYLSAEWMEMMRVGTEALRARGMDAWYYDEDKWPSGFAGGLIPRMSADFRARCLLRVAKGQPVEAPDRVLCEDSRYKYIERVDPMGQPWYNGASWVDLMNPAMVRAFIDSSYKPYADRFAGQSHVMGIFTDEPQISALDRGYPNTGRAPYSPVVERVFRERCGYALDPVLPALFDTVGQWRRVRLDYYRTLACCMEQAFSKPMGDYCAAHGLTWTGHYNAEDTPSGNMNNEGNLMQQLRHMQQPGIDALGLRLRMVHTAKVATSVANQYGRERRISELFGISGHNLSFEDRMWITAWHTLMGINRMCPHLALYSMKGARKRDYPPAISYQQPWWGENRLFEDFSARLCYFATVGRTRPEVCVLSPIESDYIAATRDEADRIDTDFERLMRSMMAAHINFDMGDEQILADTATVSPGRLVVGAMAYPVVVLPGMTTIRATTLRLLDDFHRAGGTVVVCGDYPSMVDAAPAPGALAALRGYARRVSREEVASVVRPATKPLFTLSGADTDSVWTHLRETQGGAALQLSNMSRQRTIRATIALADTRQPVALWNPADGRALALQPSGGAYTLELAPAQTWILTTGQTAREGQTDGVYRLPGRRTPLLTLADTWQGRRLSPNALTLDFARFSRDGGETWGEAEPVLAFYERTAAGHPYSGPLLIRYHADIDRVPATCRLAMEQPAMYRSITVNGQPVSFSGDGYYVDASFRTADIAALLRQGGNDITLSLDYVAPVPDSPDARTRYGTEIESVYLVGDFGVSAVEADVPLAATDRNRQRGLQPRPAVNRLASFAIAGEPTQVRGDLTRQGFPFFAGSYELSQTFVMSERPGAGRYILTLPGAEATLVGVRVNGQPLPTLFASPWEADVTGLLRKGRNEVTLTLTGSLRNLLGPHHHKGGEFVQVGPATFTGENAWPNSSPGDRDWYDARQRGNARLWRDAYHLIPFGLLQAPVLMREETERGVDF